MLNRAFVVVGAACLTGGAFLFQGQTQRYVLISLLLFWPLLTPGWRPAALPGSIVNKLSWLVLLAVAALLLLWQPQHLSFALTTLLFAALPEEWFFRAYCQTQLQRSLRFLKRPHFYANFLTSTLFAFLHGLTQNWTTAILVFFPSIFFGWLYHRTRDLVLVILIHALSNIIFIMFLKELGSLLDFT